MFKYFIRNFLISNKLDFFVFFCSSRVQPKNGPLRPKPPRKGRPKPLKRPNPAGPRPPTTTNWGSGAASTLATLRMANKAERMTKMRPKSFIVLGLKCWLILVEALVEGSSSKCPSLLCISFVLGGS